MELNDELFKTNGFASKHKEGSLPTKRFEPQEAALYIGVSASLFDEFVNRERCQSLYVSNEEPCGTVIN